MKKEKLKLIASAEEIKLLKYIKKHCDVKFKGSTEIDVHNFIHEWLPKAQLLDNCHSEYNNSSISIPLYQASKHYYGNDLHGTWDESVNLRDTIAHDEFEGNILRGMDPRIALLNFQENAILEKLSNFSNNEDLYEDNDEELNFDFF